MRLKDLLSFSAPHKYFFAGPSYHLDLNHGPTTDCDCKAELFPPLTGDDFQKSLAGKADETSSMADREFGVAGHGRARASESFDRADIGVSAVLIAICAVLWWDTTRWPSVPASLAQNAPPTTFPRLLLGSVVLMALLLPFERIWKARGGVELEIGGEQAPKPVVFITAAVLFLAVYLMPILGIAPVMLGSSILLPWLWGERRWLYVIIFAFALTAAVTILFAYGLRVNLGFGLTGDIFR